MNALTRILGLVAPYRGRLTVAALLTVAACLLNLPVPLLIQALVDRVVATGQLAMLPWFAAAMLGVFALQAVVAVANAHAIGPVGLAVVRELRHSLYARLQRLGLGFFDRMPAGAIISRLMDDVAVIQALITSQTLTILTDLGTTVVVAGLLLARDTWVALVVLTVLAGYAVTFRAFTRRIRAGSDDVRQRLDRVFGHLKERLDAILVVKAHAREEAEVSEFACRITEAHGPRLRLGWLGAAFSNLTAGLNGVGGALVFAVAAYEVVRGRMTPGEVLSTATLAGLLFGPVARLADLANVFEQAAASSARLAEILDAQPDVSDPPVATPLGRCRGHVEFDDVWFAYKPGQPVIKDVDLRVEPGTKVAIVGPTGCGKSTLMNLLLRFHDPLHGEIRLDGIPLRELSLAELRRQIGVVQQEPVVFAQSLADNIRYGAPDADAARVEAAARAALVHDFAIALPNGYDTIVGEGGHKLSQGERQRVAIARAFCKDPALVVLDEATSALDTEGEALIQEAIGRLMQGRTAFIIAHRLATVAEVDTIVVLDGGRIAQIGTHHELLAEPDGLYHRLCARQFGLPVYWRLDEPDEPRPHNRACEPLEMAEAMA